MPAKKYDWEKLKREFILQEKYLEPTPWLRAVHNFTEKGLKNGNTQKHIVGWSRLKADEEQIKTASALKRVRELEKKRRPELYKAKMAIVDKAFRALKYTEKVLYDKDEEGNLFEVRVPVINAFQLKTLYGIIKTELGEPTNINKNLIRDLGEETDEELSDDEIDKILKGYNEESDERPSKTDGKGV